MNDLIMMLTRYIVFLLLCTVIFVLAHLPIRLMRYKIDERFLHCRTIAGFAILILISGNRITLPFIIQGLDWVVSKSALTMFFDRFMPQRNYELIYMILIVLLMNIGMLICADLVTYVITMSILMQIFRSIREIWRDILLFRTQLMNYSRNTMLFVRDIRELVNCCFLSME